MWYMIFSYSLQNVVVPLCIYWFGYREMKDTKYKKLAFNALQFYILAVYTNLVYTGLLGWNKEPGSTLELTLDIATGTIAFVSMFISMFLASIFSGKESQN